MNHPKTAHPDPRRRIPTSRLALPVLVTLGVVAVDQLAKSLVRHGMDLCSAPPVRLCDHHRLIGPLGLLRTENTDSAFGLFGGDWGLLALVLIALAIMAAEFRALSFSPWLIVSVALQAGGLLSNVADRLLYGSVTDFVDLRIGNADKGLVLNPADIALALGGLMFLIALDRRLARPTGERAATSLGAVVRARRHESGGQRLHARRTGIVTMLDSVDAQHEARIEHEIVGV